MYMSVLMEDISHSSHSCSKGEYFRQPLLGAFLSHFTLSIVLEARQAWTPPAQAPGPRPRR